MNILLYLQKCISMFPACKGRYMAHTYLLLLLACSCCLRSQGQSDKNLALAEKYYAAGEYLTAAGLYEQFLHPKAKGKTGSQFPLFANRHQQLGIGKPMDKLDVLYKQAESYRLANYWPQASARYKECFDKNQAKYADALYWHAASERSIGNYPEAEEILKTFLNNYAEGSSYKEQAKTELETLQFIRQQLARPDSVLYNVKKIDASFGKGAYAPMVVGKQQLLITSTTADSVKKPGINPFHNRLFQAGFNNGSIQHTQALAIDGLDASLHQGTASINADGNYLYLTQWKTENGKNISAVYYARKQEHGWSTPVLLPGVNEEGFNSKQPFCTTDGKYLFFSSDRPGGSGDFDIWYAPLQADGTTGEPVNAGTVINSSANEQSPFYHSSGSTLVFSSNRAPGMGGYDLFSSKGNITNWEAPTNMGHPINSSRDDVYFFASPGESLLAHAFISSDRGSDCCLEMYAISKAPKNRILSGAIVDCRNNDPLSGAEVVLKNATGDSLVTTTGPNGNYEFDLTKIINAQQLSATKDPYKKTTGAVAIAATDESGWLTDILMNSPICLEQKLVIKVENVVTVYFDFDKSELNKHGIGQMDSIYTVLNESPDATIQISGYTDGRGSEAYNKKLSDKRAKSCADYLIQKGIDPARIGFESFGACCPIEMEQINGRDNPDARGKNRRALINISK